MKFIDFWKKWNLHILGGTLLVTVILPLLIYGIVKYETSPGDPATFLEAEGIDGDVKLRLPEPYEWLVIADDSVSFELLRRAAKRWNDKVDKPFFTLQQSHEFFDNPYYALSGMEDMEKANIYRYRTAGVQVLSLPDMNEGGGLAAFHYCKITGVVNHADIYIDNFATTDVRYYEAVLVHELGHLLLFADQERHKTSIMRRETNPDGVITTDLVKMMKERYRPYDGLIGGHGDDVR